MHQWLHCAIVSQIKLSTILLKTVHIYMHIHKKPDLFFASYERRSAYYFQSLFFPKTLVKIVEFLNKSSVCVCHPFATNLVDFDPLFCEFQA